MATLVSLLLQKSTMLPWYSWKFLDSYTIWCMVFKLLLPWYVFLNHHHFTSACKVFHLDNADVYAHDLLDNRYSTPFASLFQCRASAVTEQILRNTYFISVSTHWTQSLLCRELLQRRKLCASSVCRHYLIDMGFSTFTQTTSDQDKAA